MSSSGDGYNEEVADYEASYGDYNLANQDYEDGNENADPTSQEDNLNNETQNESSYDREHQRDGDNMSPQEKYESNEETGNIVDNRSAPISYSSASKLDDDERYATNINITKTNIEGLTLKHWNDI